MAVEDVANLETVLQLPWVQDAISETEYEVLDKLGYLDTPNSANLTTALNIPWVQDDISEIEYDIIDSLGALEFDAADVVLQLLSMPFLFSPDATDVLAIQGMEKLADEGRLAALTDHAIFQDGITEEETTLIAAVGTLRDSDEIQRLLEPGVAAIETVSRGKELSPNLKISIARTGSQAQPRTVNSVWEAVDFAEGIMQRPLPVSHVIVVLNDKAYREDYAGANFGFAFGYNPDSEQPWVGRYGGGGYAFQSGIVHEVAHYYWRGHENWIDEGVANTFEYMFGLQMGVRHWQLQTPRSNCEAHDLEMLSEWNPDSSEFDRFSCNYFLGEMLFLELLDVLGAEDFDQRLRELYRLSLEAREAGEISGIDQVRQVFHNQAGIVEKHWSGKLNAPENRPIDGGMTRERLFTASAQYEIDELWETMPQLAETIESLHWVEDGVDSLAESRAVSGLTRLAAAGHTARLIEAPWVVEGRNYPALESLWNLASYPDRLVRVMAHSSVSDGITDWEAKIIATLSHDLLDYDLLNNLLDPAQGSFEERTITLPLAGEVELTIIRTLAGADHMMDLLERAVRGIEDFTGFPFPQRQVIYLFVDADNYEPFAADRGTHVEVFSQNPFVNGQSLRRGSTQEAWLRLLAREASRYYWGRDYYGRDNPPWLHEGAAELLAHMVTPGPWTVDECGLAQTIAELESPYLVPDTWACHSALGESLLQDLYNGMEQTAFRQAFRRLYLHTVFNDSAPGCGTFRLTICLLTEAFTTYASEDNRSAVEEVINRWYGDTGLPSARIRGVVTGLDGQPQEGTALDIRLGRDRLGMESLWVDIPSDGTFDVVAPSGSYIIEVNLRVGSEWFFVGWYDGSGGITTDLGQAFEVTVEGVDVLGIEIVVPADRASLLCPPGSWRSSRDGQCV